MSDLFRKLTTRERKRPRKAPKCSRDGMASSKKTTIPFKFSSPTMFNVQLQTLIYLNAWSFKAPKVVRSHETSRKIYTTLPAATEAEVRLLQDIFYDIGSPAHAERTAKLTGAALESLEAELCAALERLGTKNISYPRALHRVGLLFPQDKESALTLSVFFNVNSRTSVATDRPRYGEEIAKVHSFFRIAKVLARLANAPEPIALDPASQDILDSHLECSNRTRAMNHRDLCLEAIRNPIPKLTLRLARDYVAAGLGDKSLATFETIFGLDCPPPAVDSEADEIHCAMWRRFQDARRIRLQSRLGLDSDSNSCLPTAQPRDDNPEDDETPDPEDGSLSSLHPALLTRHIVCRAHTASLLGQPANETREWWLAAQKLHEYYLPQRLAGSSRHLRLADILRNILNEA